MDVVVVDKVVEEVNKVVEEVNKELIMLCHEMATFTF